MDMNTILHDPVITGLFIEFIDRCNHLINKRNNIDHVENLQINTKIPRDDVENDIDLTLRENLSVLFNQHRPHLKNISNDIDHVENLQINNKIPRDDVENDIDLTLREYNHRRNYLKNISNNLDHVENLQINNKIPRGDFENDIDYTTSREDIPVNHHSINFKEIFDLSDKCISQQTFDDVYHQINNLDNLKMSNINNILRLE